MTSQPWAPTDYTVHSANRAHWSPTTSCTVQSVHCNRVGPTGLHKIVLFSRIRFTHSAAFLLTVLLLLWGCCWFHRALSSSTTLCWFHRTLVVPPLLVPPHELWRRELTSGGDCRSCYRIRERCLGNFLISLIIGKVEIVKYSYTKERSYRRDGGDAAAYCSHQFLPFKQDSVHAWPVQPRFTPQIAWIAQKFQDISKQVTFTPRNMQLVIEFLCRLSQVTSLWI